MTGPFGRSSGLLTPSRRAWAGATATTRGESGATARAAARARAARREAKGGGLGAGGQGDAGLAPVVAGSIDFVVVVVVARVGNADGAALCVPDFDATLKRR